MYAIDYELEVILQWLIKYLIDRLSQTVVCICNGS